MRGICLIQARSYAVESYPLPLRGRVRVGAPQKAITIVVVVVPEICLLLQSSQSYWQFQA